MPLPPGVQRAQILKAVQALLKHIEKQKKRANELIEEEELIYLVSPYSLYCLLLPYMYFRWVVEDADELSCFSKCHSRRHRSTPERTSPCVCEPPDPS